MSQAVFSTADAKGYFSRMLRGETPPAPVLTLLGSRISAVDVAAGSLSASYEAQANFRNPAGTVQGGMLSAMLDDLTASLVDATLGEGQGVATLNLNVTFSASGAGGLTAGRSPHAAPWPQRVPCDGHTAAKRQGSGHRRGGVQNRPCALISTLPALPMKTICISGDKPDERRHD